MSYVVNAGALYEVDSPFLRNTCQQYCFCGLTSVKPSSIGVINHGLIIADMDGASEFMVSMCFVYVGSASVPSNEARHTEEERWSGREEIRWTNKIEQSIASLF